MASKQGHRIRCAELPGRGRGLLTTREVSGGAVLLGESPWLLYVAHSGALIYCGACLRTCPHPTASCAGCRAVTFCSRACSLKHCGALCSALSRLEPAGFEGDAADQARFLIAAYHLALIEPKAFEGLMMLEGVGKSGDVEVRRLHSFVLDVVRDWPWKLGREVAVCLEVTAALLAKDARNTFGHMAPFVAGRERSVRGFDYLDVEGDSNTDIYIRAVHTIPTNTEVTISYFPINWSYKDRVERLSEEYGFLCRCKRCQLEECWSEGEGEDEDMDEGMADDAEMLDRAHANGESASGSEELVDTGAEGEKGDDELEHTMFFMQFLCPIEDCGGTMAPLASPAAPGDSTMECNMCGHLRTGDALHKDVTDVFEFAVDR